MIIAFHQSCIHTDWFACLWQTCPLAVMHHSEKHNPFLTLNTRTTFIRSIPKMWSKSISTLLSLPSPKITVPIFGSTNLIPSSHNLSLSFLPLLYLSAFTLPWADPSKQTTRGSSPHIFTFDDLRAQSTSATLKMPPPELIDLSGR